MREHHSYLVEVYAGIDPLTGRRRYLNGSTTDAAEADRILTRLLAQVDGQRHARTNATLGYAIDEWLSVQELEQTTRESYQMYVRRYIKPALGDEPLPKVSARVLEQLYAQLRRCRARCTGRPAVDHRVNGPHECRVVRHRYPPGRPPAGGYPDHDCAAMACRVVECFPHQCRPLANASILKIHFVISGALSAAVRWEWIASNPADAAKKPRQPMPQPKPPTAEQAAQIVTAAWAEDDDWGTLVWLVMVTGIRRAELHVYAHYGRDNAAQVANVITYRPRSAVRDIAKAFGFAPGQQDAWSKQLDGWGSVVDATDLGIPEPVVAMANELIGFPATSGSTPAGWCSATDLPLHPSPYGPPVDRLDGHPHPHHEPCGGGGGDCRTGLHVIVRVLRRHHHRSSTRPRVPRRLRRLARPRPRRRRLHPPDPARRPNGHARQGTGALLSSVDTAALPDGAIYKACGNRRGTVCPHCAETYRRDAFHVLRAGMVGGKGVPADGLWSRRRVRHLHRSLVRPGPHPRRRQAHLLRQAQVRLPPEAVPRPHQPHR